MTLFAMRINLLTMVTRSPPNILAVDDEKCCTSAAC